MITIGLLHLAALLGLVFFVFGIDVSAEFVNSGAEGGIGRFAFVIAIVVLLPRSFAVAVYEHADAS